LLHPLDELPVPLHQPLLGLLDVLGAGVQADLVLDHALQPVEAVDDHALVNPFVVDGDGRCCYLLAITGLG
jgi:hypothetical protein